MMKKLVFGKGFALILLAGCATIQIPNATVSRAPNGELLRLTGTIQGSLIDESPFAMQSVDSDLTCSGSTDTSGQGQMTCSDGSVMEISVPSEIYGRLSGSYVTTLPDGTIYASGWGSDADLDQLTQMVLTAQ